MNNIEKQKELDVLKWKESQNQQTDLSGLMNYCAVCPFKLEDNKGCVKTQLEREQESLCAKAFNKANKKSKSSATKAVK